MVNKKGRMAKRRAAVAKAQFCVAVLSFQRGLALTILTLVAMVMLKRIGLSNSWASCGTALLALPFVARLLIRPLVCALPAKGWLLIALQAVMGIALWLAAGCIEPKWGGTEMWTWLAIMALVGAVHDVLAEDCCNSLMGNRRPGRMLMGLSMLILSVVIGLGITLLVAGGMEVILRNVSQAWQTALRVPAGVMLSVAALSALVLPSIKYGSMGADWKGQTDALKRWWKLPKQWAFALFIMIMTFQEMLVAKGVLMFLVDPGSIGGLLLVPHEVAYAYGTVGGLVMLAGLLLGYQAIRSHGLRLWAWPMVIAAILPDVALLYLAYAMPSDIVTVCLCLAVECFGCGFAMAGLTMYLKYYGYGRGIAAYWHSCLALMALAVTAAGVVTGFVQDYFGYRMFFVFVIIVAAVAALSVVMLRLVRSRRK